MSEQPKRKRGGQPVAEEDRRFLVSIYLTRAEKAELDRLADVSGTSLSEYVRNSVFKGGKK